MKKLLFVIALGAFAACGSGKTEEVKKDSVATTVTVDSTKHDTTTVVVPDSTKKDTVIKK